LGRRESADLHADTLGIPTDFTPNDGKASMNPEDIPGLDELFLDSTLAGIEGVE
jgi:hypothetical protein